MQSEIFNVEQGEKINQTAHDDDYADEDNDNDGKKRIAGMYNNKGNSSSRSSSNNIVQYYFGFIFIGLVAATFAAPSFYKSRGRAMYCFVILSRVLAIIR